MEIRYQYKNLPASEVLQSYVHKRFSTDFGAFCDDICQVNVAFEAIPDGARVRVQVEGPEGIEFRSCGSDREVRAGFDTAIERLEDLINAEGGMTSIFKRLHPGVEVPEEVLTLDRYDDWGESYCHVHKTYHGNCCPEAGDLTAAASFSAYFS